MMQIPHNPIQGHEQVILYVTTSVLTIAVIVCGYFLGRLVKQVDLMVGAVNKIESFIAAQDVKNQKLVELQENDDKLFTITREHGETLSKLAGEHEAFKINHIKK